MRKSDAEYEFSDVDADLKFEFFVAKNRREITKFYIEEVSTKLQIFR